MKKLLLFPLLASAFVFGQEVSNVERCMSHKVIEYQESITPGFKAHVDQQFEIAKQHAHTKTQKSQLYTIPVVVHIVYNTPDQNLPDSVVFKQIQTLNEDYQRLNADTVNMRADFDIVKGSPNIKFQLAQIDPQGNPTTGITRTETTTESFGDLGLIQGDFSQLEKVKQTAEGGHDPWNQDRYLNIWVCNMELFNTPFLLGYASPPAGLPNWPPGSIPNISDGVVIQYQAFGANNPNALDMGQGPLNVLGRTCTHEVGHYLGLRHIWGDGGCTEQDGIDDTPNASDQSQFDCDDTKNTCTDNIQNVDLPDMIENYMDYSAEECQNSFTQGQIDLMRGVLENQRFDLVNNNPASVESQDLVAAIYPNPASSSINVAVDNGVPASIEVYSLAGNKVLTATPSSKLTTLAVNELVYGIYMIRIMDQQGRMVVEKFVKK